MIVVVWCFGTLVGVVGCLVFMWSELLMNICYSSAFMSSINGQFGSSLLIRSLFFADIISLVTPEFWVSLLIRLYVIHVIHDKSSHRWSLFPNPGRS